MMKIKTAIVTGASGFLGGALTRHLLQRGIRVYGFGLSEKELESMVMLGGEKFVPIVAEFDQYSSVSKKIQEPIDVFFHFAWAGGFTTAIRDYRLQMKNAAYAGDALTLAHDIGCKKFVYAGTYNEFEIMSVLSDESPEPRYTCIYSTGKTAADLICRTLAHNCGMEYCIGYIPMPYGEGNYSMQLVNVVLKALMKGESPKLIEGNNLYDLVYVNDIAKAFIAIGENGVDKRGYYIGHRQLGTFRELMLHIRDTVAPNADIKFGEYKDNQVIDYRMIDLEALYRDTKFECTEDFESSIKRTAAWVTGNL